MNICVIGGTGKLGTSILDEIIKDSKNEIVVISRNKNFKTIFDQIKYKNVIIDDDILKYQNKIDIIVDCSNAQELNKNIDKFIKINVPLIIATTDITDEINSKIKSYSLSNPVCISPNFSIKSQVFFKILEYAIKMMNKDTDIDILEFHGKSKIDMPSGTAKYIQNILATENTNHQMVTHSIRSGNLTGKHQVLFTDQENCSIEITYSSGARSSYAKGIYMCISELSKFDNGIISFDKICGVSK